LTASSDSALLMFSALRFSFNIVVQVYFLWRPFLKDAKDDMVLELAIESNSDYIITFNKNDFVGSEKFGKEILTPSEFLTKLKEKNEHIKFTNP